MEGTTSLDFSWIIIQVMTCVAGHEPVSHLITRWNWNLMKASHAILFTVTGSRPGLSRLDEDCSHFPRWNCRLYFTVFLTYSWSRTLHCCTEKERRFPDERGPLEGPVSKRQFAARKPSQMVSSQEWTTFSLLSSHYGSGIILKRYPWPFEYIYVYFSQQP